MNTFCRVKAHRSFLDAATSLLGTVEWHHKRRVESQLKTEDLSYESFR
jgi:hypothetical protein